MVFAIKNVKKDFLNKNQQEHVYNVIISAQNALVEDLTNALNANQEILYKKQIVMNVYPLVMNVYSQMNVFVLNVKLMLILME